MSQKYTISTWMPQGIPGNRGIPDKLDFVIVKGWPKGDRNLEGPTTKSPKLVCTVNLVLAEFKFTDDIHMHEKDTQMMAKHAPLADALRTAGWAMHPEVASVVVGHRSSALHRNKEAVHLWGLQGKRTGNTFKTS